MVNHRQIDQMGNAKFILNQFIVQQIRVRGINDPFNKYDDCRKKFQALKDAVAILKETSDSLVLTRLSALAECQNQLNQIRNATNSLAQSVQPESRSLGPDTTSRCTQTNELLKAQLAQTKKDLNLAQSNNRDLQTELDRVKALLADLQAKNNITTTLAPIDPFQGDDPSGNHTDQCSQDLAKAQDELANYTAATDLQIQNLTDALDASEEARAQLINQTANNQNLTTNLTATMNQQIQNLTDKLAASELVRVQLVNQSVDCQTAKNQLAQNLTILSNSTAATSQQIQNLTGQLAASELAKAQLANQSIDCQTATNQLNQNLTATNNLLTNLTATMNQQVQNLTNKLAGSELARVQLVNQSADCQLANSQLGQNLTLLTNLTAAINQQIQNLTDRLAASELVKAQLANQSIDCRTANDQLNQNLTAANNLMTNFTNATNQQIQNLTSQLAALQLARAQLVNQSADCQTANNQLSQNLTLLSNLTTAMNQSIQNLTDQLAASQQAQKISKNRCDQSISDLNGRIADIADLAGRVGQNYQDLWNQTMADQPAGPLPTFFASSPVAVNSSAAYKSDLNRRKLDLADQITKTMDFYNAKGYGSGDVAFVNGSWQGRDAWWNEDNVTFQTQGLALVSAMSTFDMIANQKKTANATAWVVAKVSSLLIQVSPIQ